MKLQPVRYNPHFGYNKKLSEKLRTELNKVPSSDVTRLMRRLDTDCCAVEEDIIRLEGTSEQDIDDNEEIINMLLSFLMPTKLALAKLADRFFPKIVYSKTEADEYDLEHDARTVSEFHQDQLAYNWRNVLFKNLEQQINSSTAQVPTPAVKMGYTTDVDTQALINKYEPKPNSPMSLDDVVGLRDSIDDINDLIITPLKNPELAQERLEDYGIEFPNFAIFYGPPGCGKTMLAEAIANQTDCPMYTMSLAEVGSKFVNGTTENVSALFKAINSIAQQSDKPVILFMDEMDALLAKREYSSGTNTEENKVVDTLLPILQQAKDNNILVIGATNMFDAIDPAIKRRAELSCYIGLPNKEEIVQLLKKSLSNRKKAENLLKNDEALAFLAEKFKGYSPDNINKILKKAARIASRKDREISLEDVIEAERTSSFDKINEQEYLSEKMKNKKQIGF